MKKIIFKFKCFLKEKNITLSNMYYYMQGNIRYSLYYSAFFFLIRKHIREQIVARIQSMDKECYANGQCKLCGCKTTALQMSNKACDKPCYPPMMPKKVWKWFKTNKFLLNKNMKFYKAKI